MLSQNIRKLMCSPYCHSVFLFWNTRNAVFLLQYFNNIVLKLDLINLCKYCTMHSLIHTIQLCVVNTRKEKKTPLKIPALFSFFPHYFSLYLAKFSALFSIFFFFFALYLMPCTWCVLFTQKRNGTHYYVLYCIFE